MPPKLTLSKPELKQAYESMLLLRRFEERAANLYLQGEIAGFCHLYTGQEAILAGCKAVTQAGDDYITSYRCHAHALVSGVTPEAVMSELTGKATGISGGKGGSMHMFDPEKHFWGGHGIVAAQVPLGAGLAFANKYKKNNNISLTFLGDGATNAGQFFETLNMAALWGLPILFIIENNCYGMGTTPARAAAGQLFRRGEPFGIPGEKVDGQDFFAVQKAVKNAADYVRGGSKPYIIEMDTYRYRGHSMSDPATYRSKEEVAGIKENRDPITNMAKVLLKDYGFKQAELDKMDDAIKAKIRDVAEFATSAPVPAESELATNVVGG